MAVSTVRGDPQAADPSTIVLLPGYMTDADLWRDFAPALHGYTPHHADLVGSSLEEIAANVLRACPPRFVLLGFSLGGYVAQEIIRQAGDRILALVLVATSARAGTPRSQQAQVQGKFKGLSSASVRASLGPQRQADLELIARIQRMGERLGDDAYRNLTGLTRPAGLPALEQLRCPLLVIAAENDGLRSPDQAQEMVAATGADFVQIQDSGHMIPMEQPLHLAAVVRQWLDKVLTR